MSEFVHPGLDDVPLSAALHALACPVRLEIVQTLSEKGECNCEEALPRKGVPKSSRSNHMKVLRSAGVIATRKDGRERLCSLRREEFSARFPGILEAVLLTAERERFKAEPNRGRKVTNRE